MREYKKFRSFQQNLIIFYAIAKEKSNQRLQAIDVCQIGEMGFLEFVTTSSSVSAAEATSELVDLQEQHAQEAWALDQSKEAKMLFEHALE